MTVACVVVLNLGYALAHTTIGGVHISGTGIVAVERVVAIVEEQLDAKRWLLVPQKLSAFFHVRRLRQTLEHEFPFANWSVDRHLSGTLAITAREEQPAIIWAAGNQAVYLNQAGHAFAVVPHAPAVSATPKSPAYDPIRPLALAGHLPAVHDDLRADVVVGEYPLDPGVVEFTRRVARAFNSGEIRPALQIIRYRYDRSRYLLTAETLDGYEILFATNLAADEQLNKLTPTLAQGIAKNPRLKYIDLRFGGNVYYRDSGP